MDFINAFQRMDIEELREQVINLLKDAYSDGRIGVDSLERRLKEATIAKTKDELMAQVADIPAPEGEGPGKGAYSAGGDQSWSINRGSPGNSRTLFAILGSSDRTGRWQPPMELSCFSLMGSIKLDFRQAEFPRSGVTVNAGCVMGSLDIIVPPGINVELSGIPLLGSLDNKSGAGDSGAPLVSIKAVALMGSVEIKRKEVKKPRPEKESRRRGPGRNRRSWRDY